LKTLSRTSRALLLGSLFFVCSCKTPLAPPEAQQAEVLDQALWRSGAYFYAEENYVQFKQSLKSAKEKIAREKAKFGWFRDYEPIRAEFRELLQNGEDLLAKVEGLKSSKSKYYSEQAAALSARIERLKQMTDYFNENGPVRKSLAQAEIKLSEAGLLLQKEQFESMGNYLSDSMTFIRRAEQAMMDVLSRYMDRKELEKWRRWADETIVESKAKETIAILVNKLERKLTLYKKGVAVGSYDIGLGKYGLSDKLYSGDEATPEGRYHIIRKIPSSPFYKALLINYPNEEDQKAFALAKNKGLVPAETGIGGYIEIHGGGKDNLTKGCIGLNDRDMDEIYRQAEVGTAVTIVGAVSVENTILADIKKFEKNG
jgi:L,D-peptidoglycan transpeptidase YkuD (ErfK/YbiS/YcfS/YnhG family)